MVGVSRATYFGAVLLALGSLAAGRAIKRDDLNSTSSNLNSTSSDLNSTSSGLDSTSSGLNSTSSGLNSTSSLAPETAAPQGKAHARPHQRWPDI
ncbi:hypothetical protein JCM6882_008530 [Rhodosporidiobolus microsporus]